jgi:hypothetical protein
MVVVWLAACFPPLKSNTHQLHKSLDNSVPVKHWELVEMLVTMRFFLFRLHFHLSTWTIRFAPENASVEQKDLNSLIKFDPRLYFVFDYVFNRVRNRWNHRNKERTNLPMMKPRRELQPT